MANYNLTNQPISASFQQLLQKNDNDFLVDGTGSLVQTLKVTGSVSSSTYYGDGSNLTGISGGGGSTDTGSLLVTASVVDATTTYTKGDGSTFTTIINNVAFSTEAEDLVITVKNTSGGTLAKGTAVHAVSVTGENVDVIAASNVSGTDMPAIGLLSEEITNNASGTCIIQGRETGIDTSNLVAGAPVYVHTNGTLTATKPTGSALIQNIGTAAKINASDGEIIIQGSGRVNDLPNITEGYLWVGDGDGVPEEFSTGSFVKQSQTGSFATTGFNEFFGNQNIRPNYRVLVNEVKSWPDTDLLIKAAEGDDDNIIMSGSVDINNSVNIQGNVTSSISKQNVIVNPQTITDDITIGENSNALVVGDVTFAGSVTIGSGSELSIFDEPQLGELIETASISGQTLTFTKQDTSTFDIQIPAQSFDTGSFLTTASYDIDSASFDSRIDGNASLTNNNTLSGNQIISGSTTAVGGLEVGNLAAGSPAGNATLGVMGGITLRSGSGIQTDGAFGNSVPFDSNVTFFNGLAMQGTEMIQIKFADFNPQNPLPGNASGGGGRLAVSGSNLYFNNGTTWTKIN